MKITCLSVFHSRIRNNLASVKIKKNVIKVVILLNLPAMVFQIRCYRTTSVSIFKSLKRNIFVLVKIEMFRNLIGNPVTLISDFIATSKVLKRC